MLRKTTYVSLLLGLVCLSTISLSSVLAINLNVNSDPELPFGRIVSQSAASYPSLSSVPCVDGMADIYPCDNIDLMAFMPFSELGTAAPTEQAQANDIWGWTDPQTGDEYAILGLSDGTSFIRVTDPENPVLLGFLQTHTVSSSWRDIKVYDNHAFIVSEATGHGMQVFDLTQLSAITTTSSISQTNIFTNTTHYGEFGNAHNIVINEETGYAYPVGADVCAGGLHFVNIADPINPVNEGCFDADGYTHDAQCVIYDGLDTEHVGKEICFNANEDTLTIVDVTDKSAPVQLSRTGYDNARYTHQGWLTQDHAYFLLNDELDEQSTGVTTETYVWDVADLDTPAIEIIYTTGLPSIDHNLYTRGDTAFLSNYTSGLRVLSVSDPTTPLEIGYFDVYPQDDNPNFEGTWSNYPYFESGTVIISSIERGLFIVQPQSFAVAAESNVITSCDGGPVTANISVRSFFDAADSVTLTTTASGDGTAVLGAESILIGESGELTITPSTTGEDGVVQLIGTLGDQSATTEISIIQAAPSLPVLGTPLNYSGISSFSDTFSWEGSPTATSYLLEVSDTADFTNIVFSAEVVGTSRTIDGLPANQKLYWRVSAVNNCGSSPSAAQTIISLATTEQCGVVYSDQFETDSTESWFSYTFEPDEYLTEDPLIVWELGETGAYTGTGGWSVTDTGYSGAYLFPPILEVSGTPATLRFWQKRNLGADDAIMLVYFNGETLVPIDNEQMSEPFDTTVEAWADFPLFTPIGWSGVQDWTETVIDVSPYISPQGTLDIFFIAFMGNDGSNNTDAWAIDDVSIEACSQQIELVDLSTLTDGYGVAWHGGNGEQYIGTNWSSERVISTTDTSDNLTLPTLQAGQGNTLTVDVAQDGWLMGWFDWNGDGEFSDDELTIDQAVISATNSIEVAVSADTPTGDIAYRFRVTLDSASPALSPMGFAADGEVEDGTITIAGTETAVTMSSQLVNTVFSNTVLLIIGTVLLVSTVVFVVKRP